MTERRPLVSVAGSVKELPTGDTVYGAGSAMPTYVAAGATFTVAADTQVLYYLDVTQDGDLVVDGDLVQV